jgi:hypothetical protein
MTRGNHRRIGRIYRASNAEGGVPFISDADLEKALDEAGARSAATDVALEAYSDARIAGLRSALAILALLAIVALFLAQRIPTQQPGKAPTQPTPGVRCPKICKPRRDPCKPKERAWKKVLDRSSGWEWSV